MKSFASGSDKVPKILEIFVSLHLFTLFTRIQDNVPGLNAVPWVGVLELVVILIGLWVLRKEHFNGFLGAIFWASIWFSLTGIGAISTISFKLAIEWGMSLFPQMVAVYAVYSRPGWPQKLLKLWVLIFFTVSLITIKNGGTGPGSFLRDENDLALVLSMAFPLCVYFTFLEDISVRWKLFALATAALIVLGIVLSSSRGGLLGFIAMIMAMVWLTEKRTKYLVGGLVGALFVGGVVLSLLPERYVEDMRSISDSQDSTRVERLRTWETCWVMFKNNPIMGIGAGNVPNTAHLYEHETSWYDYSQKSLSGRQAHSIYFQVIPELGLLGILAMIYLFFVLPAKSISIARNFSYQKDNIRKIYLNIMLASMAAYVAAGAFISVLYYPVLPVWLMMFSIYRSLPSHKKVAVPN